MTITLELSADDERRLRECAAHQDVQAVRQLLFQAVDSAVERLLQRLSRKPAKPDFQTLADRLAERFAASNRPDHRPLTDDAVSREGIYADHP
ncbi:MAG: hypothetical protein HC897_06390 [Thermoanaerobaculia bacterium]|nr:hypothetical protein [Thermoanaerobaculia bacterium]